MKSCPKCHAIHSDELLDCPSDNTPLGKIEEWHEGSVIKGKYRILAKVSQDIACTVYKAIHVRHTEYFALHVLHSELAHNPEFVELFKQGARRQKKLQHTNIAQVKGIEKAEDGLPFIIMEYADGRTLKEIIQQEGPLAPLRACGIAKRVADGLKAAHALGIVHRDLKPESIFMPKSRGVEKVKLQGFGISEFKEALVGDQFRTSPDTVIGAVQYLSPEQALGRPSAEVDGRADLYSLGVILYQMLTRELPFKAAHAGDWMTAHILGTPISIRVAHPDLAIPDPLSGLVMECMQKSPLDRPASASDFIRQLKWVEKEVKIIEKSRRKAVPTSSQRKSSGWKFWKS